MARLFFRLKLRLIRNGLRGRALRVVSLIFGVVIGLQFALGGFALLAAPQGGGNVRAATPVIGFVVLFAGWSLAPVFGFGLDETLDPSRLALLPLSRRQLMTGLFAASATGIAPAATLVALAGAIFGYAWIGAGTVAVIMAVALEFALCLVGARAMTTAASRLLRSRRARDLWAVGFSLFALLLNGLFQSLRFVGHRVGADAGERLASILRWLPPGMAGRAVVDADGGRLGVAAIQLVPPVVALALLAVWWARNLERLSTTAETASPPRRARVSRADGRPVESTLYPRIGAFLPRNRRGAVAAKELRYLWREPSQRAQRLSTLLLVVGALVAVGVVERARHPPITLASTAFLWWLTLGAMQQFGIDREAFWMNVVAAGDPEDDLVGKNLAIAVLNMPVFLVLAVAFAAITGGWAYLPVALATGLGALGVALGVGNVTSVRLARPVPESTTNLWAQRTGQGCGTGIVMLTVLLVSQILVAPIAALVLVGLGIWPPLLAMAIPLSIAYGALLYLAGRRIAAAWLRTHQAELLEALSPRSV